MCGGNSRKIRKSQSRGANIEYKGYVLENYGFSSRIFERIMALAEIYGVNIQ